MSAAGEMMCCQKLITACLQHEESKRHWQNKDGGPTCPTALIPPLTVVSWNSQIITLGILWCSFCFAVASIVTVQRCLTQRFGTYPNRLQFDRRLNEVTRMKQTVAKKREGSSVQLLSTCALSLFNLCLGIVHYDGHRHVWIFEVELLVSLPERGATFNFTKGSSWGCWEQDTCCDCHC